MGVQSPSTHATLCKAFRRERFLIHEIGRALDDS